MKYTDYGYRYCSRKCQTFDDIYPRLNVAQIWNALNGYDQKVKIIVGLRSTGKTTTLLAQLLTNAITKNEGFVVFVKNGVVASKYLSGNGERIIQNCIPLLSPRVREVVEQMTIPNVTGRLNKTRTFVKKDDAIMYLGKPLFSVLPIQAATDYKSLGFDAKAILFDEFIADNETYQTRRYPELLNSLTDTVVRNNVDTKLYLSANYLREFDPIMQMFGMELLKPGETRATKNAVAHHINRNCGIVRRFIDLRLQSAVSASLDNETSRRSFLGIPEHDIGFERIAPRLSIWNESGFIGLRDCKRPELALKIKFVGNALLVSNDTTHDVQISYLTSNRTNFTYVRNAIYNQIIIDDVKRYINSNSVIYFSSSAQAIMSQMIS